MLWVCKVILLFQRLSLGNCPQTSHNVGSWSKKSTKYKNRVEREVFQRFGHLILCSPDLYRKIWFLLDLSFVPLSGWYRHTPVHPAFHLSLPPPLHLNSRHLISYTGLYGFKLDYCKWGKHGKHCCHLVVSRLTCTSLILGCVNKNCSISAG